MHEEEINGFDLQLRSMLEDATEKAPRRVWKAVDSALGHSRASFAKWGWAALSCLAAASLALVLALPGGKAVGTDHMVAAVENEVVGAPQAVVEQEETLLQEPVRHISSRPYAHAKAAASQEVHSESASPVQPETAEAAQAPQDGGESASAPSAAAPKEPSASKAWRDPLAEPVATYSRPRTKLAFGGSLGSNDNVSSGFVPGGRYATQGLMVLPSQGLSETGESSYAIPLTFGVDARFYLSDRISLGTGVQYTILSRSFQGTYKGEKGLSVTHALHYVGIPLNLYADIVLNNSFDFYAFGGAAAEIAVKNQYNISTSTGIEPLSESVDGLQWSVGAGVGLQFNLSNTIGIFVDPSLNYYFDCNQPRSIRTESPFVFNLKAGLRFNL